MLLRMAIKPDTAGSNFVLLLMATLLQRAAMAEFSAAKGRQCSRYLLLADVRQALTA